MTESVYNNYSDIEGTFSASALYYKSLTLRLAVCKAVGCLIATLRFLFLAIHKPI